MSSAAAPRDKGGTASSSAVARSTTTSSSLSRGSEDLNKTWRSLANCLIMAAQKADRAAASSSGSVVGENSSAVVPLDRETDEYICNYLKIRVNWGRLLTYLEAELEGKAQEIQSLQHYYRSMPKCSTTRPTKRARVEDGSEGTVAAKRPPEVPEVGNPATGSTAATAEPTSNVA